MNGSDNQSPRWYCINTLGMATLCKDEEDARSTAAESDSLYPQHAPHRPVQLMELGAVQQMAEALRLLDECRSALMESDRDCDYPLIERIEALAAAPAAPAQVPLTDERLLELARLAGLDLEPTRNHLIEVRGQHAQLVNFARAAIAASKETK